MTSKDQMTAPLKGRIHSLIGRETLTSELCSTLKSTLAMWKLDELGAMLITCADEVEHECSDAFQKSFCTGLLPRLKIGSAPPFRISNLGGRYEWMSLTVAESHFIGKGREQAPKLMLVKINSHVAIRDRHSKGPSSAALRGHSAGGPEFGVIKRHELESDCCAELMSVLKGESSPITQKLSESWQYDGRDRLAELYSRNENERALYAAILSARMQARSCVLEAQDMSPRSPTVFMILPCVSINRPGRDGEIPVGVYLIDRRPKMKGGTGAQVYHGLSDHPGQYQLGMKHGRVIVTDEGFSELRDARNHRLMIQHEASELVHFKPTQSAKEVLSKLQHVGSDQNLKRKLLKSMIKTMVEASPIGTAAVLFGSGAMGIWHTYKTHQLIKDVSQKEEARELVEEVHKRVDHMPPEQAAAILNSLAEAYQK